MDTEAALRRRVIGGGGDEKALQMGVTDEKKRHGWPQCGSCTREWGGRMQHTLRRGAIPEIPIHLLARAASARGGAALALSRSALALATGLASAVRRASARAVGARRRAAAALAQTAHHIARDRRDRNAEASTDGEKLEVLLGLRGAECAHTPRNESDTKRCACVI